MKNHRKIAELPPTHALNLAIANVTTKTMALSVHHAAVAPKHPLSKYRIHR
jgi:hypothetical protein